MSNRDLLQAASVAATSSANYVEDVFSTYLYTGDGATRTIANGIDLVGRGGLTWIKQRSGGQNNTLFDTARGVNNYLRSASTGAQNPGGTYTDLLTAFNNAGFSLGADAFTAGLVNGSGSTYASWTFRKQAKFFDIVTYTGTGVARTIAHNLGSAPGCVIVKRTNVADNWQVYHRGLTSAANSIQLNSTAVQASAPTIWNSTAPTSSVFSVGTNIAVNASGGTYVAYIFAHDAGGFGLSGGDNIISCGSFTTDINGASSLVNLGYEPQWILYKSLTNATSTQGAWQMVDSMRGLNGGTTVPNESVLFPNTDTAESAWPVVSVSPTGFQTTGQGYVAPNSSFIYIAIRRPMKTPTTATSVFMPITRTGTGATGSSTSFGQVTDLVINKCRTGATNRPATWTDRLRGATYELYSTLTNAEAAFANDVTGFDNMSGFSFGTGASGKINDSGSTYVDLLFKRARGFFDIVCYTGTGVARTISHNLGVAPELVIVKTRSNTSTTGWITYAPGLTTTQALYVNTTAATTSAATAWGSTAPTASNFSVGTNNDCNTSAYTYVAYLFASLAGVSKVGSYTGNGTSQTIGCGFAAGARFVMVKCTSTTGDWFMWDTARGIVVANDPHSSLNTNVMEVTTDDSVDPNNTGFIVNQVAATNINVNAATYIYLAIA